MSDLNLKICSFIKDVKYQQLYRTDKNKSIKYKSVQNQFNIMRIYFYITFKSYLKLKNK